MLAHNYMQHILTYLSAKLHISSLTVGLQCEGCTCVSVPACEYKFVYIGDKFSVLLGYHPCEERGWCRTGSACVRANTFALFAMCIKPGHQPPIAGKDKLHLVQKSVFLSDECGLKGEEQVC